MPGRVYVARDSGVTEVDGEICAYTRGITRVREGHPLLKGREDFFEPVDESVHYDIEQATSAPGERRASFTVKDGNK